MEKYTELQLQYLKSSADGAVAKFKENAEKGTLTYAMRWHGAEAMKAEIIQRELHHLEAVLLNPGEFTELAILEVTIEDWTKRVMRTQSGQSTCPITNVANAAEIDAYRELVSKMSDAVRYLKREAEQK